VARQADAAFPGAHGRIAEKAAPDALPAWSPNGKKIAFTSRRRANTDIYAVNATTKEQQRLTADPAIDFAPDWRPLVD